MNFNTHHIEDKNIVVIDVPERLTSDISDGLKQLIKELVANEHYKIVMNLENTNFMDSSGLGAIVSKISITRSNRGDIKLAAPQRYVTDLLNITHINKVIEVFDNVEQAVKGFDQD